MEKQQKFKVLSSAERAVESRLLVLPSPGDVIIMMMVGWALFCFFLVTGGTGLLAPLARLARDETLRQALLGGGEFALTLLMLGGLLLIISMVLVFYNFRKLFFGLMLFSLTFASASWQPLHDFSGIVKYLGVIFFACMGGVFFLKNFWRMIATPYIRLLILYFFWITAVSFLLGGRTEDIWYVGTDFSFIIGFSIAWLSYIDNNDSLMEFNRTIAWAAVAITFMHLLAPLLADEPISAGRFKSYFFRSTGYAVFFSPAVLALFWMGMAEKNNFLRQFFSITAIVGMVLLLWSGTRSATLALIIGITLLWWVFKSRIFIYIFLAASLGLLAQIIGASGEQGFQNITERLQDMTDTGRFTIWAVYFEIFTESPVYGHSLSGVTKYFYSEGLLSIIEGSGAYAKFPKPHNAFLGMAVRFGAIGLILLSALIFMALRRARQVIFSKAIPAYEKQAYVLPLALVVLSCVDCMFEDALSSTGRGTLIGFLFFPSLIICELYGTRLLKKYRNVHEETSRDKASDVTLKTNPNNA